MPNTPIQEYFDAVNSRYKRGTATEHSYRGDLQKLIEAIVKGVTATNEPKRIDCGAPDYIITNQKEIPVGYIEAKDIGKSLDEVDKSEQLKRYKESLDNLILTDYLGFRWYIHGEKVSEVSIAHIEGGKLKADTQNWSRFEDFIKDFCSHEGQTITSAETLAKMMAAKARMMHHVLENALTQDEADSLNPDTALQEQYKAFKDILIHDISNSEFSDIYAQTIAYGMFAARLHDTTPEDFTREKAAKLIPGSNPFLRKLFQFIAGYDLDTRLSWIVDTLAEVFRATDINAILKNFGKSTQQNDPVIHFYETFLKEYNPALRKSRGVWYTPEPVVNFIVRAVDDILKTEFGLKDGLADTSKVEVEVKTQNANKNFKEGYTRKKVPFHKVQILDPATGTGTFLAEVVKQIYKRFEGQQGIWSNYVDEHLIPRVNGFEILMASYAIAHLKLEMLLAETGHKPKKDQRLRVFLTNSLEESHPDTGTLFAQWLSTEANEANHIKRDSPVMVVLGNPPYAISSSNDSIGKDGEKTWIGNLIDDYKKNLNERKINLDDDYIKFIRFGQHFIDKNGEGVLAYISNNSFIEGITHRQMRKHLLESFDKVYILDLHGDNKKGETALNGSPDQNVFDIMSGVSINLFIKTGKKKTNELGKIFHYDLIGKRDLKYEVLNNDSLKSITFKELSPQKPYYFFVPKNFTGGKSYEKGFKVTELFRKYSSGIHTGKDHLVIDFDKTILQGRIKEVLNENDEELIRKKYDLIDTSGWKLARFKSTTNKAENYVKLKFRPFDDRWILYENKALKRDRGTIMQHIFKHDNLGLVTIRRSRSEDIWRYVFVSDLMTTEPTTITSLDNNYLFPLYLYPESSAQQTLHSGQERKPNLSPAIIEQIGKVFKLRFVPEQSGEKDTFAPIDILDYIYAVLHSPAYREKYKEFLKIDFPRVPYPKDISKFWALVKLGGELRQLHLLESKTVEKYITTYPIAGNNEVTKPKYIPQPRNGETEALQGDVFINDEQCFKNVPLRAWGFYIGGYQPAQKWLKDRQGRLLSYDDITHYQKIIVALTETARLMWEIDKVGVE